MPCRRFIVSGKVQGVWYRASTRDKAVRLGLTGHAINLPGGGVEVLACGAQTALDELAAWLWQGPEMAEVSDIVTEDLPEQGVSGFLTG